VKDRGGGDVADRERDDLTVENLSWPQGGLIPAIVQQHDTGEVLMLAWMDREALRRTLAESRTWFWSRSRQAYWAKGETSGNVQRVIEVRYDCDADTLLVEVDAAGPACHTGEKTCFYRTLRESTAPSESASPREKT
jgi:phosphoribosyl-AMP cyclohydrolase